MIRSLDEMGYWLVWFYQLNSSFTFFQSISVNINIWFFFVGTSTWFDQGKMTSMRSAVTEFGSLLGSEFFVQPIFICASYVAFWRMILSSWVAFNKYFGRRFWRLSFDTSSLAITANMDMESDGVYIPICLGLVIGAMWAKMRWKEADSIGPKLLCTHFSNDDLVEAGSSVRTNRVTMVLDAINLPKTGFGMCHHDVPTTMLELKWDLSVDLATWVKWWTVPILVRS